MKVMEHLALLGHKVEDKVTGIQGIVATVGFDLYGCIQVIVNRGVDKDGKLMDGVWFDINRLKIISTEPVMTPPNYEHGPQAEARQGAAEKPSAMKP